MPAALTNSRKTTILNPTITLLGMVTAGGAAALSWEILWQTKVALSLGISAMGTAVTLAVLMGGMAVGAILMGTRLRSMAELRPLRVYGTLELFIGLSGLLLMPMFRLLERLDSLFYQLWPSGAVLWHLVGISLILGPPALAMGASVPVFGLLATRHRISISTIYGWNTAGSVIGVLATAFVILPVFGIFLTSLLVATINILIGVITWAWGGNSARPAVAKPTQFRTETLSFPLACLVVFVTGFATFGLEVAWFRSLRSAYFSTTHTFAILLAAVLLPIALAARKASRLRGQGWTLGTLLAAAGAAILLATPVVERFDLWRNYTVFSIVVSWFIQTLVVVGPAIFLLGIPLPWLLDEQKSTGGWARLYAVNTSGAIFGSLLAAWGFLPMLGFARTAWLIGLLTLSVALALCRPEFRWRMGVIGLCSLAVALTFESGVGRNRTLGPKDEYRLVAFAEAPDSTVSVVEMDGDRHLFIDGFSASCEADSASYMAWMGRLPMLLHAEPKNALVICFGTGQTSHALRQEGPTKLDIVDLNQAVLNFADRFSSNHGVLQDPRTRAIVMDGRAWLRRNHAKYDVITLEPMPPTFAGVNALYSHEFYELASQRLRPNGVVAQWLPIHLVDQFQAASVSAAFQGVFPDSVLWLDPASSTGILVGRRGGSKSPLGTEWPGLSRDRPGRSMDAIAIRNACSLSPHGLRAFAAPGRIVTDDNQLLAYNWSILPGLANFQERARENLDRIRTIAQQVENRRHEPVVPASNRLDPSTKAAKHSVFGAVDGRVR